MISHSQLTLTVGSWLLQDALCISNREISSSFSNKMDYLSKTCTTYTHISLFNFLVSLIEVWHTMKRQIFVIAKTYFSFLYLIRTVKSLSSQSRSESINYHRFIHTAGRSALELIDSFILSAFASRSTMYSAYWDVHPKVLERVQVSVPLNPKWLGKSLHPVMHTGSYVRCPCKGH